MNLFCRLIATVVVLTLLAIVPRGDGRAGAANGFAGPAEKAASQIHSLKVTVLSTMLVGQPAGIGEWGFAALMEPDGHRILVDTGSHPETVALNAKELKVDLANVHEVILTHNHWDHVAGLVALRREVMKNDPAALSVVHVSKGIFYSRPGPGGEDNQMIAIRKEFEATGGKFIEHDSWSELFPGAWLSGPSRANSRSAIMAFPVLPWEKSKHPRVWPTISFKKISRWSLTPRKV